MSGGTPTFTQQKIVAQNDAGSASVPDKDGMVRAMEEEVSGSRDYTAALTRAMSPVGVRGAENQACVEHWTNAELEGEATSLEAAGLTGAAEIIRSMIHTRALA